MKFEELRSGYFVELRNGNIYLLITVFDDTERERLIGIRKYDSPLDDYNWILVEKFLISEENPDWDIVRVWIPLGYYEVCGVFHKKLDPDNFKIVYADYNRLDQ